MLSALGVFGDVDHLILCGELQQHQEAGHSFTAEAGLLGGSSEHKVVVV